MVRETDQPLSSISVVVLFHSIFIVLLCVHILIIKVVSVVASVPHHLSLVMADGHQPLSPVLPEVFSCLEAVFSHHCCQLFTHSRLMGL